MQFTIQAYVVLLPLFALWLLIVRKRRRTGSIWWSTEQFLARLAFVVYIVAVLSVTLFPIDVHTGDARRLAFFEHSVSIIPFHHFQPADFILNIVMMVPLGIAMGVFWPRSASIPLGIVVGYVVGGSIELVQLVGRISVANDRDVTSNDIIANTLGVVVGVWVYRRAMNNAHARMQLEWIRDVD